MFYVIHVLYSYTNKLDTVKKGFEKKEAKQSLDSLKSKIDAQIDIKE